MIPFILTSIFPAVSAIVLPGFSPSASILIQNCEFSLGEAKYNICPIFSGAELQWPLLVNDEDEASRAVGVYGFHLEKSQDGSQRPRLSRQSSNQCPPGTLICLTKPSPSDPRISQDMPIVGASSAINFNSESDDSLNIRFDGGSHTAEIRLICDARRSSKPTFSGRRGTVHSFTWRTPHGCKIQPPVSGPLNSLAPEAEQPPPGDDSEPPETDEDQQLVDNNQQRRARRSTVIVFLLFSFVFVAFSIISYKHPRRIQLFITEYIKPFIYRLQPENLPRITVPNVFKSTGEGRLLQWAHEDLELDEDFMVNAVDPYDESEDGADEYIPLRPSPRKGGRPIKNYGSATSPFW